MTCPAERLVLGPDEVHVWYVRTPRATDALLLDSYAALLSEEESRRRLRFLFDRDRHTYLVSRALVRTTLSRYADVAPADWQFVANAHGRPEIVRPAGCPPLRFNLSHTGGLAAMAVTLLRDVGIDVEDVTRRDVGLRVAEHYFAAGEVADLFALPPEEQRRAFFDYWTLKEAYIKARGMGLALPLDAFCMRLRSEQTPRIEFEPRIDDDPARWSFHLWRPTSQHTIALAADRGAATSLAMRIEETLPQRGLPTRDDS